MEQSQVIGRQLITRHIPVSKNNSTPKHAPIQHVQKKTATYEEIVSVKKMTEPRIASKAQAAYLEHELAPASHLLIRLDTYA